MHQIIHLSPVRCFTPARVKTEQKNREVSRVNAQKLHDALLLYREHRGKGLILTLLFTALSFLASRLFNT